MRWLLATASLGLVFWLGLGSGTAQTSCTVLPQATVLGTMSDNAAAGSITPQTMRNAICSTAPVLATTAVAQTLTTSPFSYTAAVTGKLVVLNGKVELSSDSGANWYVASLTGGAFPLLINDAVRVTWFGAGASAIPLVTFFPGR